MKALQLVGSQRNINRFLWLICLTCGIVSCDILESDPDVVTPNTEISGDEVVVMANSTSFIDLNSKVTTNVPARIAVTSDARNGNLTDIGKGLLQYSPSVGSKRANDSFEFTVYTLNNEVIKRDTIVIRIENDSTNLPCNIYPAPDYVYGVSQDSVIVNVTANDIICGGPVNLSVFKPDNSFPPNFGYAALSGNKIIYNPGPSFTGTDKIIYKLTAAADSSRYAYGVVYIIGDSACNFSLENDAYVFNDHAADSLIVLPVFGNDSLCYAIEQYQVNLKSLPVYGLASLLPNGISYTAPASVTFPFTDHFTYEICKDANCKTARVDVTLKRDSVTSCTLRARRDSVDMTDVSIPSISIDVLANDSICGDLKTLKIVTQPAYGSAAVVEQRVSYHRDPLQKKDDSLEYEICNGNGTCSRAIVTIKQKS